MPIFSCIDFILDEFQITTELFNNFIDNLEDVKVTLPEDQINKLQTIKLNETNIVNYSDNCSICLDSCNLNEKLLILKTTRNSKGLKVLIHE